jgi:hypothetical protein
MITTIDNIKNYLLIDIEESFESQIEEWIADVEEEIEKETGRKIIADEAATERVFKSEGGRTLIVDEFVMDGDYAELVVMDDNSNVLDVDYEPFNRDPRYKLTCTSGFPAGKIRVTARWGYAVEAPRPLVRAATVLVAGIINNSNQHDGEVQSETIGRYTVTYKTKKEQGDFEAAKETIKKYRRITF